MIALLNFHSNDLAANLTNVPDITETNEQWTFSFFNICKKLIGAKKWTF